ncbi:MAG TPA: hypothetical protein VH297_01205 [Gaiellaceae bacterium]
MAPPDLYDQPARPGLMCPGPQAPPFELSLRAFFWGIAIVLGAVELFVEAAVS